MTLQEALDQYTRFLSHGNVESPRLSAELLTAHAASLTRAQVLAHGDRKLIPEEEQRLAVLMQRRANHEPVPYILGEIEFYSIPFFISPGVFIPRPETELLVEAALAVARKLSDPPLIFDLGTGSGCIIISLAINLDKGIFRAGDLSPIAVQTAQSNVRRHGLQEILEILPGAFFDPIKNHFPQKFDLIVSNPPYIKTEDIPHLSLQIQKHEPITALDGGPEGMHAIQTIIREAAAVLKPGGTILLEAEPSLMAAIHSAVQLAQIYENFMIHKDAAGNDRVVQFQLSHSFSV